MEGGGFEPPKAEPTDLQSAPFDRSGTPPAIQLKEPQIMTVLKKKSILKFALQKYHFLQRLDISIIIVRNCTILLLTCYNLVLLNGFI